MQAVQLHTHTCIVSGDWKYTVRWLAPTKADQYAWSVVVQCCRSSQTYVAQLLTCEANYTVLTLNWQVNYVSIQTLPSSGGWASF